MGAQVQINGATVRSAVVGYGTTVSLTNAAPTGTAHKWEILNYPDDIDGGSPDFATNFTGWTVNGDGVYVLTQTGSFTPVTFKPDVTGDYLIRLTSTETTGTVIQTAVVRVKEVYSGQFVPASGMTTEANTFRGWGEDVNSTIKRVAKRMQGYIRVVNQSGGSIARGKVVKLGACVDAHTVTPNTNPGGSAAAKTEWVFSVTLADNTAVGAGDADYAILDETIANNGFGWAQKGGLFVGGSDVNYSGFTAGTRVYFGSTGTQVNAAPGTGSQISIGTVLAGQNAISVGLGGGVPLNTLLTGAGTGQTVYGAVSSGGSLTLGSTIHATKGIIYFGADHTTGYNEATAALFIGGPSTAQLTVTGPAAGIDLVSYGGSPSFDIRTARGTSGSPAAVQIGDDIGSWAAHGHTGSGWDPGGGATIRASAAENFTPTAQGTVLRFMVKHIGSHDRDEVLRISETGSILVHTQIDNASSAFVVDPTKKVIASGTSVTWDSVKVNSGTVTVSGSTGITTSTGFNLVSIGAPTLSAASALTVLNAATVTILGPPTGGGAGPLAITNPYVLWLQGGGVSRVDGTVRIIGSGSYVAPSLSSPTLLLENNGSTRLVLRNTDTVREAYMDLDTDDGVLELGSSTSPMWLIGSGQRQMSLQTGTVILSDGITMQFGTGTGTIFGTSTLQKMSWWNNVPVVQGTVTGSRGSNAALASLLTLLNSYGLAVDSSTA